MCVPADNTIRTEFITRKKNLSEVQDTTERIF